MANERLFYVGVKGLIKNREGKILLLKADVHNHSRGTKVYWDIPGGRIDEDSDVLTTLQREIEEETGITELSNIEFFTAVVSHHQIPLEGSRTAGLVLMIYTVEVPEDSKIVLNPEEHTEHEWVETNEAATRLANKYPEEFTSKL